MISKISLIVVTFLYFFIFLEPINSSSILGETIESLEDMSEIKYVTVEMLRKENTLDTSKNTSSINTVQDFPYELSGKNIRILQYEAGVAGNHPDFNGRLEVRNLFPETTDHATHVAGILIGNGTINSSLKGVAPKSQVISYQIDSLPFGQNYDLESNFEDGINNNNTLIISNSWASVNCQYLGSYSSRSEIIDRFIFGNFTKPISIVFSVGNLNHCEAMGYNTVSPEASAKNVVSVGNVYDDKSIRITSSFGPTDDGRVKPELVAVGMDVMSTISNESIDIYNNIDWTKNSDGIDDFSYPYDTMSGTSMSAPHVSGTIVLTLEQWNKSGYDENQTPIDNQSPFARLDDRPK